MQSRPADLDILIADLGSYEYAGLSSGKASSMTNSSITAANPQGSGVVTGVGGGGGSTQIARNGLGLTRKLSLEDLEWHSKDSKHNRSGSNLGIKNDGSSCKSPSKEGDDVGNVDFRDSHSISRTDSMGNEMFRESNGYDDHGASSRGRSQSKDFDSLTSVLKLIRSTKKKIQSIEELEGRMKDGSLRDFNDEQIEKISKKEATQAEMKRLKLIFTRLEGEERVKTAAKAVREREKEKEKSLVASQFDEGDQGSDKSQPSGLLSCTKSSPIGTLAIPAHHPDVSVASLPGPASSSHNTKSRMQVESKTADGIKNSISKLKPNSSSANIKITGAEAELRDLQRTVKPTRPVEPAGTVLPSASKTAATAFIPPSFNDWVKATDEFVPGCPRNVPELSSDTKIEGRTAWGLKASTPPLIDGGGNVKKGLGVFPGTTDLRPAHEISISHIGLQGRTVLSPPFSKAANNPGPHGLSQTSVHMSSPYFKVPTSIQSNEGDKALNKDQNIVEKQPAQGASYSLSLADLLITPNKRTNKQKRESTISVPIDEKASAPELLETKYKSSCPWLSLSITSPQSRAHHNDPIDAPIPNMATKIKQKSLSEIQVEEEVARLQSNLISLKGNYNPWYQERRKRADSIEAVIRSQAEEKIMDEANRIEEENAVRQVDLLKKRERRERGKIDRNKQDIKSDLKPNTKPAGRVKKDPNATKGETSTSATAQVILTACIHSNMSEENELAVTAVISRVKKVRNESESSSAKRSTTLEGQCSGRSINKGGPRLNPRNIAGMKDITLHTAEDGYVPPSATITVSCSADSQNFRHPARTGNAVKSSGSRRKVGFEGRNSTMLEDSRRDAEGKSTGDAHASC